MKNKIAKTVNTIEVQDWDDLVEKTYGRPYCFQQQDGCHARGTWDLTVPEEIDPDEALPDTVPEVLSRNKMGVNLKAWLARDPQQKLRGPDEGFDRMWWHRNFYPDIQEVANDLHARGLLEAGEYVINIDW